MKIIHFANRFLPLRGGVELSVARTAEAQARLGHDVCIVTETDRGFSDDASAGYTIRRFSVPIVRPFTRMFYWRWMWRNRIQLNGADVLHFHDYTTFIHWFGPLRAVIRKPMYAITFHGFEHWPILARHRFFRMIAALCTDLRFAVGSYVTDYYHHPVDIVYTGAPVHKMHEAPRSDDAVFAYVGRLAQDTGILDFAKDLCATANTNNVKVVLRLGGEGELREALSDLISEHFAIQFFGVVEDPVRVFAGARFIVATGFLAMFDAFQTGLPVVVPAYTPLKHRYAHSIDNIQTMAMLLTSTSQAREVLSSLLRRSDECAEQTMTNTAREWIATHTWDEIASIIEAGYQHTALCKKRNGKISRRAA